MLRDYIEKTYSINSQKIMEMMEDLKAVETRVMHREKPFQAMFTEQLLAHKKQVNAEVKRLNKAMI